ncbi:MAG: hypothetical protein WAK01_07450 [Methylocystis sp.]
MVAFDHLRRKPDGDEQTTRRNSSASEAAERSRTLTQRLLAFAHRQDLEARPVDVAGLLDGMRELIQRSLSLGITAPAKSPSAKVDATNWSSQSSIFALGSTGSLKIELRQAGENK